ncbi:hypothetical protein QE152_g30917 [Popillia japonica]|uniref:Uncharacterized protein n=1 Tax=Popillia japonica TaxID=7064 RepID=A0AAW1JDA7_POPJA
MEKDKENKLNEEFRKYIDQKEQGIEMKEKIGLKVIKSKESNHTNLNGKQEENRIKEAEKLCYLTIQTENKKLTIINIHAPTEEKKEEEKEMFYEELERVVNIIPKNNIKMV